MSQTKVEAPFLENNRPLRNIMINGDMAVSQRGDSTGVSSSGYYACDRWNQNFSDAGTFSVTQSTDVPAGQGFSKSLKLDCTTADTSVAAGSVHRVFQRIEAQMMAAVESGSANAKQTVWSFWIKFDNASGDFCVNVLNLSDSNNRVIAKKFTYASGAGWQKYSFVIPGDTGGNALTPDNSGAYYMQIFMQAGTNFTSGTLQTTWDTRADANRAAGQTLQLASSTDNNMYLTGCQWEIGDAPSDFEHTPFDVQLQRCQRYYYLHTSGAESNTSHVGVFNAYSSSNLQTSIFHPVQMRAAATADFVQGTGFYTAYGNGGSDAFDGFDLGSEGNKNGSAIYTSSKNVSVTQASPYFVRISGSTGATARVAFSAEI